MEIIKPKLWTPREYQTNGIQFVIDSFIRESGAGVFLKPGLGKTTMALETILKVKKTAPKTKVLIVAPLRVAQISWPLELKKWLNFYDLTYTLLWGPHKAENLKKDVDIYLINYEGLDWLDSTVKHWPPFIVFDELTKLKNWTAKRTKLIKRRLGSFTLRLGLTGTPITNGLEDLFSQIHMLDRGKRFGHSITRYRQEFFYQEPYSFKYTPHEFANEIIIDRIKDLCYTVDESQHLDLPEIVYTPLYLDLPPALRKDYNHLRKECLLQLNAPGVTITSASAAATSAKLRQFLAGTIYDENRQAHHIHSLKTDVLKEFVEDLNGTPILIGYHFRFEPDQIKVVLPFTKFIPKGASEHVLQEIALAWNKGEYKALAGHPMSIGYGLNLQESTNLIFMLTLDFSADPHEQFIKRIARSGQKERHVLVYCPLFRNTIDEYVFEILQGKQFDQKSFLMSLASENEAIFN